MSTTHRHGKKHPVQKSIEWFNLDLMFKHFGVHVSNVMKVEHRSGSGEKGDNSGHGNT